MGAERDGYPVGVPCWIDTAQPDPQAAAEFYGGLFGWEFEDVMPAGAPMPYLVGRLRGRDVAAVTAPADGAPQEAYWNSYVAVAGADETAEKVTEAGGRVLAEPFDAQDAGRMAVVADPAGAPFSLWEARNFAGAGLVNDPGSWNFSGLSTPDPEGAKAFYRAVFGWKTSTFTFDGVDFTAFAVEGYGDHLAESDPAMRERMEGDQAPSGFEDVVATLMPQERDDEAPPHWGITFGVAEADETAERAAQLGGEVIVPPFDAPYVRMTVLRDPQGAVFTASKYVPPR